MAIPELMFPQTGTNAIAAFQQGEDRGRQSRLRDLAGQAYAPGADRQALQQQAAQAGGFQGAQGIEEAFKGIDAQKAAQAQATAEDMMRRVLPIAQAKDPAEKAALFQQALQKAQADGLDISVFSRMTPDQAVEAAYGGYATLQDQLARAGFGAPAKPQGPMNVSPGGSVVDPNTGKVIYQAPFAPRDPSMQIVAGPEGFYGINKGNLSATPVMVGGQQPQAPRQPVMSRADVEKMLDQEKTTPVPPQQREQAIQALMYGGTVSSNPDGTWAIQPDAGAQGGQQLKPAPAQAKPADPMKAKKLADMARKEKMLLNNTRSDMDATVKLIDDILAKKEDFGGVTGMGAMGAKIPGTDWADIAAKIQRLQARSAFGTLAEMRAASPTGGALGAVSERELAFLQNAAAALQDTQSPAALAQALKDYKAAIKASRDRLNSGFSDYYNGALAPTAEDANAAVGPIAPPDQFSGFRVLD